MEAFSKLGTLLMNALETVSCRSDANGISFVSRNAAKRCHVTSQDRDHQAVQQRESRDRVEQAQQKKAAAANVRIECEADGRS